MTKLLRIGSLLYKNGSLNSYKNVKVLLANSNKNLIQNRFISSSSSNVHQQQGTKVEEKAENFLSGNSTTYIEEIYQSWLADPKSVHKSWDIYFRTNSVQVPPTLGQQQQQAAADITQANLSQIIQLLSQQSTLAPKAASVYSTPSLSATPEEKIVEDHLKLYALIRSYQIRGHKKASLDPLGIGRSLDVTNEKVSDLTPEFYNFTENDMDRVFKLPKTTYIGGSEESLTLREILHRLNNVYCKSIGLEYMYINNFDKCNWIRQQFESPGVGSLTPEDRKRGLKRLIRATR